MAADVVVMTKTKAKSRKMKVVTLWHIEFSSHGELVAIWLRSSESGAKVALRYYKDGAFPGAFGRITGPHKHQVAA
jgi:hypothetical protein